MLRLIGDKHSNLLRELQQRDCKDDGNNAGSIYLDRHVCTSAACLFSAYHLGGILHRQSSFTGVYTNNESKNNNQNQQNCCYLRRTCCTAAGNQVVHRCCACRQVGNDVDEDNHRGTVADSACSNLLRQPHNKCGAAYQTKYRCNINQRTMHQIHVMVCVSQTDTLNQRQNNRQISAIGLQLLSPSGPSLESCSNLGIAIVNSCIMMDALM